VFSENVFDSSTRVLGQSLIEFKVELSPIKSNKNVYLIIIGTSTVREAPSWTRTLYSEHGRIFILFYN